MPLIRKTDEVAKRDAGDKNQDATVRDLSSFHVWYDIIYLLYEFHKGEGEGPSPSKKAKVDDKTKGELSHCVCVCAYLCTYNYVFLKAC